MSFDIAGFLLQNRLLLLGNFTLSSGKISPYYLDLRRLPSYPEFSRIVSSAINTVSNLNFDLVVGVATGGLPLASFMACKMEKPLAYARLERKGHGTNKLLEGEVRGKAVLVVDDVATTGTSLKVAVNAVRQEGGKVEGALVIVDRQEGANRELERMGVKLYSVFKITEILKSIIDRKWVEEQDAQSIMDYLVGNLEG
jgi:orotate phosphoribosyltransferase